MVGVSAYLAGASMESLQDRDAVSREQMSAVESYVRSNPDKVFVHDMSFTSSKNSYDPFRKNEDEKTSNLIMLGGSYVGTGCFNEQLVQNDLDELNAYTLFRDDVYYISDVSRGFMDATVSYLDSLGLAFDSVQVDDLGNGIGVFKFVPLVDTAPIEESVSGIVPDQSDPLRMD